MSVTARPRFLWKATSLTPRALAGIEIVAAGIAAVGGHLAGRRAAAGDVAVEHRQEALGIGRVAGFDDEIEDQAALAGDQIELVTALHVASALDDDVGMRLEHADQLLAGRQRLAMRRRSCQRIASVPGEDFRLAQAAATSRARLASARAGVSLFDPPTGVRRSR